MTLYMCDKCKTVHDSAGPQCPAMVLVKWPTEDRHEVIAAVERELYALLLKIDTKLHLAPAMLAHSETLADAAVRIVELAERSTYWANSSRAAVAPAGNMTWIQPVMTRDTMWTAAAGDCPDSLRILSALGEAADEPITDADRERAKATAAEVKRRIEEDKKPFRQVNRSAGAWTRRNRR